MEVLGHPTASGEFPSPEASLSFFQSTLPLFFYPAPHNRGSPPLPASPYASGSKVECARNKQCLEPCPGRARPPSGLFPREPRGCGRSLGSRGRGAPSSPRPTAPRHSRLPPISAPPGAVHLAHLVSPATPRGIVERSQLGLRERRTYTCSAAAEVRVRPVMDNE